VKRYLIPVLVVFLVLMIGTMAFAQTEPLNRGRYWDIKDIEEVENPHYDMIKYSEIGAKLREIEKASNRVQIEVIGRTDTAGYEMYLAIVSEPSAGGRLGRYQALRKMMIHDPEKAQSMVEKGEDFKVPFFINAAIHGGETCGVDASIKLIEKLAFEDTEEVKNILENVILLVNVVQNPEGRTTMTRRNWNGFDMNRDFITQSQAEVRATVEQIVRWNPMVFLDLHGFHDTYLIEPCTPPHNPNYEIDLYHKWALPQAEAMEASLWDNMELPAHIPLRDREWGWDDWPPIYTPMYAMYHGAYGATTETVFRDLEERDYRGVLADYWVIWGALNNAAEKRWEMFYDQIEIFKRGILGLETTAADVPWAYLIPHESMQPNPYQTARGIDFLLFNDVEVYSLQNAVEVNGTTYPRGSYIVLMEQPKRGLANTILEDGYDMLDLYPDLPRTYTDFSAWSHPRVWGYDAVRLENEMPLRLSTVNRANFPKTTIESGRAVAYALAPIENNYLKAVNMLLENKVEVLYAENGFEQNGRSFVPGTLVIKEKYSTLNRLVSDLDGLSFDALNKVPEELSPLRPLKIAMISRSDERPWVLDQLGFDVTVITEGDLNAQNVDLMEYDVFFNEWGRWGSLNEEARSSVLDFFEDGGGYIGLFNRGAQFAADAGILAVVIEEGDDDRNNAIVNLSFNLDDPLVSTYRELDTVFVRSPIWLVDYPATSEVSASYPNEDFFLSGFWRSMDREQAEGYPVILWDETGPGRVVLLGIDPFQMAHPEKTFRIPANAIYWTSIQ